MIEPWLTIVSHNSLLSCFNCFCHEKLKIEVYTKLIIYQYIFVFFCKTWSTMELVMPQISTLDFKISCSINGHFFLNMLPPLLIVKIYVGLICGDIKKVYCYLFAFNWISNIILSTVHSCKHVKRICLICVNYVTFCKLTGFIPFLTVVSWF